MGTQKMNLRDRLCRSIETMPRPAYIFLRALLALAACMLALSALLFALCENNLYWLHLATLLLESPAAVLLLGALGLAALLDRTL